MSEPKPNAPRLPSRLRPIPGGLRAKVIDALFQAMQAALPDRPIEPTRLRASLEQRFERLCDGASFDFKPIQRALAKERGITEVEVYLVYASLRELLSSTGLKVLEPVLELGAPHRALLDARAKAQVQLEGAAKKGEKLGELLQRYRLITDAQLSKALRAQKTHGGRLGTNLVELGFITERSLALFLSVQLGAPAVDLEEPARVPGWVLSSLPRELMTKHRVLPLSLENKKLRVAMVDPTNLQVLDAIAFHTGCKVEPVVAPESLIQAAFEQHFGEARQAKKRAVSLPLSQPIEDDSFEVVHTSRRREPKPEAQAEAPKAGAPSIAVEERGEFFSSQRSDFAHAEDLLTALASDLTKASEVEEVLSIVLKFAAHGFERSAVFMLDGGQVRGVEHCGCRMSDEALRQQVFALASSPLFQRLSAEPRPRASGGEVSVADRALLSALGMSPLRLVSLPVLHAERVVGVVLASERRPEREPLDELECRRLMAKAELALRMLGLKKDILAA